jgi:hypothetical protein
MEDQMDTNTQLLITIILMLIAFIVGLVAGVSLTRPSAYR